jgi:hypothetical protein
MVHCRFLLFTRRFCGGATSDGEGIPAFFNGKLVCARSHCSAQPSRQRRKEGYAPAARQILVGTKGSGKRFLFIPSGIRAAATLRSSPRDARHHLQYPVHLQLPQSDRRCQPGFKAPDKMAHQVILVGHEPRRRKARSRSTRWMDHHRAGRELDSKLTGGSPQV